MKFTKKYYFFALILWAMRNLGYFVYYELDMALSLQLFGAYFGDLFLIYIGFHIYKWYKKRNKVKVEPMNTNLNRIESE